MTDEQEIPIGVLSAIDQLAKEETASAEEIEAVLKF